MNFEALQIAIKSWAESKGIDNPLTQTMKVMEELGELCAGILKKNNELTEDSLGDVLVTLIILADILDKDLVKCLKGAFKEISDRKGKTVDGSFIKESDIIQENTKDNILDAIEECRDLSTGALDKYRIADLIITFIHK